MLRWFAHGAVPVPWVFSNLHLMAIEGWARRHPALILLILVGPLGAGFWQLALLTPVVALAAYFLGLGLWQIAVLLLSRGLGLRVLVVSPADVRWVRPLLHGVGLSWPGSGTAPALDLHVNMRVRLADPAALFAALESDFARLAELWGSGELGRERVVLLNTFNKRMLAIMRAHLSTRGTVTERKGCVLLREYADGLSLEVIEGHQRRMFGQVLPGVRARDRPEQWDLLVVHLHTARSELAM
jgi:hypothetical protein